MILFHLVESTVKRAVVNSYHWLCHVPQNKMATKHFNMEIGQLALLLSQQKKCVYAFITESFPVTIVTVTPTVQV